MQWSVPIGRIAGSEIRIHLTFLLLLLWIGIVHYQTGGAPAATEGVLYVIAVFACVVLHEFGHALAARRYGIRTPRITPMVPPPLATEAVTSTPVAETGDPLTSITWTRSRSSARPSSSYSLPRSSCCHHASARC